MLLQPRQYFFIKSSNVFLDILLLSKISSKGQQDKPDNSIYFKLSTPQDRQLYFRQTGNWPLISFPSFGCFFVSCAFSTIS
jgi:hypothetical protein